MTVQSNHSAIQVGIAKGEPIVGNPLWNLVRNPTFRPKVNPDAGLPYRGRMSRHNLINEIQCRNGELNLFLLQNVAYDAVEGKVNQIERLEGLRKANAIGRQFGVQLNVAQSELRKAVQPAELFEMNNGGFFRNKITDLKSRIIGDSVNYDSLVSGILFGD